MCLILVFHNSSRPTQPGHFFVARLMSAAIVTATAREENGEFCVTVGPVITTDIGLLGDLVGSVEGADC